MIANLLIFSGFYCLKGNSIPVGSLAQAPVWSTPCYRWTRGIPCGAFHAGFPARDIADNAILGRIHTMAKGTHIPPFKSCRGTRHLGAKGIRCLVPRHDSGREKTGFWILN